MVEEARIACNPISSLHALKQAEGSTEKIQKRLKASALATSTSTPKARHPNLKEVHKLSDSEAQTSWQMKCHFWKLNCFIYKCEGFQALSLDKKSCLMVGHFTKDCKRKVTCNICKWIHPTPLHEEQTKTQGAETTKEEKASTALYCKRANNSNHTSMIIPVWISCATVESPEILVYALLDTQSSNNLLIRMSVKRLMQIQNLSG